VVLVIGVGASAAGTASWPALTASGSSTRVPHGGEVHFCYHRITKGMKTACVEACPFGARKIGTSRTQRPVTKIIRTSGSVS